MADVKMIERIPLRGRAAIAFVALLVIFWLPLAQGIRAAWSYRFRTIPREYATWAKSIRLCFRLVTRGIDD